MRLLERKDNGDFILTEFIGDKIPHYAILSHTWGADYEEVTYKDLIEATGRTKIGYKKMEFCINQALKDNLQYTWVDTCCIDKSSSAELSEAINSMFAWYRNAAKCYVYLSDVSAGPTNGILSQQTWTVAFKQSRWFTRGWTLQELIAPAVVEFFSVEGQRLGDKISMVQELHKITGISVEALVQNTLHELSVEERMSWITQRNTKREEDAAYSLLGIFDVYMPLIYGEGRQKAFARLRKEISALSTQQLEDQGQAIAGQKRTCEPFSTVPFAPDADFVDRPEILAWVRDKCAGSGARAALVGLGGVGKSQLAIHYAHHVRDATPRTFVFWVHASTQARFEQAYRGLADRLELPGRNDSNADVLRLVSNWLCDESNGPWMMIVDNVDDVNTFFASRRCNQDGSVGSSATSLAAYLPQSRNGLILITSRSRDAAARLTGGYHNIKEVLVMDKSQGLQLLHHKLSAATLNDQEGAIQLVRTLDYMPLAITQAAAYINRRAHMTIAGYLSEFRANDKRRASLLHQDAGDLRRDQSASNSVVTTWQMAFERVQRERPSAAELLSLMSFFNPQGIPEKTLRRYNKATANVGALDNEGETDHTFHEDFDILHAYSLITATTMTTAANHKMWEMHPLVQFCTRVWLSSNGKAEWWNGAFIELLAQEFPSGAYEYWAQCQQLLPHVELLYNTEPASEEPLKAWTQVLTNAAWYLYTKGSYHTAQVVASKAVTARERVLGFDNNQTLTSVTVLAIVLHCLKNYEEAEKLHRRVLEGREKELGAHHPDTLMSISCLGQVLQSQKRYKEAETLHRRALKGCEKELGVYHRATLMSVSSLSIALQSQGNYEEVEKLNQRAHKGFEKELGVHHPFTLKSVKDLAEVLWYKRKYEEAEKLYKQVLEVREKVLGVHHPNTLISVSDLARVLSDQGKYKEAEKLYKQVLEVREKVQGVHHPDTLISVSDLATVLSDQGKYKEAEKLFQRALEGYEKELGAYHSRTLESIDSFARFLNVSKRHEEAAEMYQRAYEVRVKNLGSQHPETLEWEEQVLWMQQNALVNKQPSLHDEEVGGNTACAESVVVCKQTDKQDSFLTRIKARMHRRDK